MGDFVFVTNINMYLSGTREGCCFEEKKKKSTITTLKLFCL